MGKKRLKSSSDGICKKGELGGLFPEQGRKLIPMSARYSPLPKSATPSRIASNADLYDFELDKGDMSALDGLDLGSKGAVSWNPVDAP